MSVDGRVHGRIDVPGLAVLLGIAPGDGPGEVAWMARKIRELRILREERSVADQEAPVLIVSQFTLYGDARKGRRPTWKAAAPPEIAEAIFDQVCAQLVAMGTHVERGVFGADMSLELVNDGPVTVLLESGDRSS